MYDIIIIGGGPAGMTAALYSLRNNKTVLIIEKESFGGQIATSPRVENYPSIKSQSGLDFSNKLFDQIVDLGVKFDFDNVVALKKENDIFIVSTEYNNYESKTVFIATGLKHRKIGIESEEKLSGKGISYCATCDGSFYKDQDVVVIGDANTALQYSLLLSSYCKSVKICTLFDKFFGDKILIDRIISNEKISYEHNLSIKSFNGEEKLESLTFENTQTHELKTFDCNGVFVAIGQEPRNEIFKDYVDLDKGFVVVDDNMETKTKGLYAIGDCRVKKVRQVVTAINDGAIASIDVLKYLN